MNEDRSLSSDSFYLRPTTSFPRPLGARQRSKTRIGALLAAGLTLAAIAGRCPAIIGAEPTAFVPVAPIPAGFGVVYVYRTPIVLDRSLGLSKMLWWRVEVEGQPPRTVRDNCYWAFVCPAGHVKVSLFLQRFGKATPKVLYDPVREERMSLQVDLRAGESCFVKIYVPTMTFSGLPGLAEIPMQKAMGEIARFQRGGVPEDELLQGIADTRHFLLRTDREWEATKLTDTVEAYRSFIESHRETECARMAIHRLEEAGISAERVGDYSGDPAANRDHVPLPSVRSGSTTAGPGNRGNDIVELINRRQIEVQVQGNQITDVILHVRRIVPYPVAVHIPVGTCFAAASTKVQNMVSMADCEIRTTDNGWRNVNIPVACMNIAKAIPVKTDSLSVSHLVPQTELAKLLPVLGRAQVRAAIRQAAVWIVTDNANEQSLQTLKQSFYKQGCVTICQSSIGMPEIVRAMMIVEAAGIDVTRKNIWRCKVSLSSIPPDDNDLLIWLRARGHEIASPTRSDQSF
jgi:hypothetical protein